MDGNVLKIGDFVEITSSDKTNETRRGLYAGDLYGCDDGRITVVTKLGHVRCHTDEIDVIDMPKNDEEFARVRARLQRLSKRQMQLA